MTVQRRNILGPPNFYDNHLAPASDAPGGDDSLSARPPYQAPVTSDQSSTQTEAERGGLESAYREAQRAAGAFTDAGAPGAQVGRGPDTFDTRGQIADADGSGPGDVIAPEPSIVTRAEGGDGADGGAYGKAIS